MEAEMTLRPMTETERMYSYTQSQQLIMQSGCIGHLSANFGSDNKHFNTCWDDHRTDLKSPDFEHEFEEVIKALREDAKYGAVFKNRGALLSLCNRTPESSFGNDREYGFRADTVHYSYMFRLNPSKGADNIICYCYLRQWLDRHMKQAERGIRFITPDYKEQFRIADGDKIRYYTVGGEVRLLTCRYIDDHHFETGSAPWTNLYHICEFAEKYQNHGCTELTPLRNSLPEKSFAHLESTGAIVVILKGEKGYVPTANYPVDCDPKESVDALNATIGVTKAQAAAMVAGSMFGWDKPAANPKNYDEEGLPDRPKAKDRDCER